jgi:hypothetical protein
VGRRTASSECLYERAAHLAVLVAPYRHPRLSATKVINGDTLDGIKDDATAEELREELAKRIATLRDKGFVDLEALPPPKPAARRNTARKSFLPHWTQSDRYPLSHSRNFRTKKMTRSESWIIGRRTECIG